MRRAWEKGPHLVNELIYQDMVDPFGIDVDSMGDKERDIYGNLKNALAKKYGSLYAIPAEERRAVTMILTGRDFVDEKGRRHLSKKSREYSELKGEVMGLMDSPKGRLPFLDKYYVPQPHRSQVPTYMDSLPKLFLPYQHNAASAFFDAQRKTTPDRQFTTVLIPEQTYTAALKHLGNGIRVYGAIGEELRKQGLRYLIEPDDGSDLFTVKEALKDFFEPERGMFVKDIASMTNISKSSVPLRLSVFMAKKLDAANLAILAVDPKDDPIQKVLQFSEAQKARQAGDESMMLPESPYIENGVIVPKKNFYLQAGMGRMLFENSPFGELNQLMLQVELSPVEEHAAIRGEIQRVIRLAGLARVSDVLPSKAALSGGYQLDYEVGAENQQAFQQAAGLRQYGPLTGGFSRYKDPVRKSSEIQLSKEEKEADMKELDAFLKREKEGHERYMRETIHGEELSKGRK